MKNRLNAVAMRAICALLSLLQGANANGQQSRVENRGYRLALPNYRFNFPRDHFDHPEFRTEWWYYTGNLRTAQGRRFGFELTFFRQSADIRPRDRQASSGNVWDIHDIWMAHLALSEYQWRTVFTH